MNIQKTILSLLLVASFAHSSAYTMNDKESWHPNDKSKISRWESIQSYFTSKRAMSLFKISISSAVIGLTIWKGERFFTPLEQNIIKFSAGGQVISGIMEATGLKKKYPSLYTFLNSASQAGLITGLGSAAINNGTQSPMGTKLGIKSIAQNHTNFFTTMRMAPGIYGAYRAGHLINQKLNTRTKKN